MRREHAVKDQKEQELFFGRKKELTRIQGLLRTEKPKPIYIKGPRGIGKTAFLQKLRQEDPMSAGLSIYIDCHWVTAHLESGNNFEVLMIDCLFKNPEFRKLNDLCADMDEGEATVWLSAVLRPLALDSIFFLLDNAPAMGAAGTAWLQELNQAPIRLVLAGRSSLPDSLEAVLSPVVVNIGPLSEKDSYDIITRPFKGVLKNPNNNKKAEAPQQQSATPPVKTAPIAAIKPDAKHLAAVTKAAAPIPIPRPSGMVRVGDFYIDRSEVLDSKRLASGVKGRFPKTRLLNVS